LASDKSAPRSLVKKTPLSLVGSRVVATSISIFAVSVVIFAMGASTSSGREARPVTITASKIARAVVGEERPARYVQNDIWKPRLARL
jgi:hypothetical protein